MQPVQEILEKLGVCHPMSYFHIICNSLERTKTIAFEKYYSMLSYEQLISLASFYLSLQNTYFEYTLERFWIFVI